MTEQWKSVTEFPQYEISNHGNLRRWNGRKFIEHKGYTHKQGYRMYDLINSVGTTYGRLAHRLVAIEFIPTSQDILKDKVYHKDGNPQHNHFTNLRWDDQTGNIADCFNHGTHTSKLTIVDVIFIRKYYAENNRYGVIKELADFIGCSNGIISDVVHNRTWKGIS